MNDESLWKKSKDLYWLTNLKYFSNINPYDVDFYSEKIEILKEGYEYHYDDVLGEISNPLPEEKSRFVIDVLNMYRDITFSKVQLSDGNRENFVGVTTYYRGFDFNEYFGRKIPATRLKWTS